MVGVGDEFRQRHVPYADAFRKLSVQTIPIVRNLLVNIGYANVGLLPLEQCAEWLKQQRLGT